METRVLLIRHGDTDWRAQDRVAGQRDVPLSRRGSEQLDATVEALAAVKLSEIIASPLQRALQSAEILGRSHGIERARDPRLTDLELGTWSGMRHDELAALPDYQRFLADPDVRSPGGESLEDIRRRGVAAVEQAIRDNPPGDTIAMVSHAGVLRVILAHYLGSPIQNYHRLRVCAGSVSVLSFVDDRSLPRMLGVNLMARVAAVLEDQLA